MVVLTLSRKINKVIGPFLLRNGIALRYALGRGVVTDNPFWDSMLLVHLSQRLVSMEVHDDALKLQRDSRRPQSTLDEWAEKTFDSMFGKSEEEERLKKMSDAELRVHVLEQYIRPALLKNETFSDVLKWRFHQRTLKWLRAEYLIAKYGSTVQEALIAYSKLRYSPQLAINPMRRGVLKLVHGSNIEDTTQKIALPATSLIEKAFDMQGWKKTKNINGDKDRLERLTTQLGGEVIELRGGALRFANIPPDTDLSKTSLEDILEIAGAHVASNGPLNALCEERDIYQLWTKEYIELLAGYLLERTNSYDGDTVILDVGAGDGLLSKYLRMAMGEKIRPQSTTRTTKRRKSPEGKHQQHRRPSSSHQKVPAIVAVDDGSWRILQKADVQKMNAEEAMKQYSSDDNTQVIVLCSWMPMGIDWTSLFRKFNPSEYILIGECDDGGCGDNWETWGNRAVLTDIGHELAEAMTTSAEEDATEADSSESAEQIPTPPITPPHEVDGYKRIDIDDLVPYQLSRFDSSASRNGKTVTFRLKQQRK